jgi:hypothetical protein
LRPEREMRLHSSLSDRLAHPLRICGLLPSFIQSFAFSLLVLKIRITLFL